MNGGKEHLKTFTLVTDQRVNGQVNAKTFTNKRDEHEKKKNNKAVVLSSGRCHKEQTFTGKCISVMTNVM